MNDKLYAQRKFRGSSMQFAVGLTVSMFIAAGFATPAHALAPAFTFTATVPATVVAGSTFTFPASITDVGGQATDYNSYFQIYDQGFHFQGQTFYTNQTFAPGQTLNYNVAITAPSTPGTYYLAALMFNQDYSSGIVSQEFFTPTFNVVAAAVPEPSSAIPIGLFLIGSLILNVRLRRLCV
ncbi:hypothetical protein CCAX7_62940 [Capsulimonas corticalis]|uniref:PEP-CTERM protein-sorting domain-containing protein n=1 Tax=Capsulimonas corticalis TaxID=2219043 RepID=A0A9N7L8H0_9BACT|nr:hypothetical protein [Capsulimonas corticalis]BDI34243.1 hypothetical protein CCAX7_62940 [Capsulimonas corticalis]